jgi:hypothetical protein
MLNISAALQSVNTAEVVLVIKTVQSASGFRFGEAAGFAFAKMLRVSAS